MVLDAVDVSKRHSKLGTTLKRCIQCQCWTSGSLRERRLRKAEARNHRHRPRHYHPGEKNAASQSSNLVAWRCFCVELLEDCSSKGGSESRLACLVLGAGSQCLETPVFFRRKNKARTFTNCYSLTIGSPHLCQWIVTPSKSFAELPIAPHWSWNEGKALDSLLEAASRRACPLRDSR